jgi:hypothetical protein
MKFSKYYYEYTATFTFGCMILNAEGDIDEIRARESLVNVLKSSQLKMPVSPHSMTEKYQKNNIDDVDIDALMGEIHLLANSLNSDAVDGTLVKSMTQRLSDIITSNSDSSVKLVKISWILGFEESLNSAVFKPLLNAIGQVFHQSAVLEHIAQSWESQIADGLDQGQLSRIIQFFDITDTDGSTLFNCLEPVIRKIGLESFLFAAVKYI